ncbi:unnamed protein product, partial [Lepidochelys olivacea]
MAMSSFAREIDAVLDAAEGKKNEELLITYKGVLYPSTLCCAETFQALDTMEVRKDDVFLAAYPKCGTNWIEHILNDLTSAVLRKEVPRIKHLQILEFGVPEKFQAVFSIIIPTAGAQLGLDSLLSPNADEVQQLDIAPSKRSPGAWSCMVTWRDALRPLQASPSKQEGDFQNSQGIYEVGMTLGHLRAGQSSSNRRPER